MASLGSKSQSVEIAGPIFDSVCADSGRAAALNNVMQPVKRTIETITDDGVVSTSRVLSKYENGNVRRYITSSGTAELRIGLVNSNEDYGQSRLNQQMTTDYLEQQDLHIEQIPKSVVSATSLGIINRNDSTGAPSKFTEMAIIKNENNAKKISSYLFKTENFVAWLVGGLDRLHDLREYLPGDVARTVIYNQFQQELMTIPSSKYGKYLTTLSEFLNFPTLPKDFWGGGTNGPLTFADYVNGEGPLLELRDDYVWPTAPSPVMTLKEHLMEALVGLLYELGLPMLKLSYNSQSSSATKLEVRGAHKLSKPNLEASQSIPDAFSNIPNDEIKSLFLHFDGMTSKDQKYISFDEVTVLLLVDAFKKPFAIPENGLEHTDKSWISSIDAANAKQFRREEQQHLQKVNDRARSLLFPEPGQKRTLNFCRVATDNDGVQSIRTRQFASFQKTREIPGHAIFGVIEKILLLEEAKLITKDRRGTSLSDFISLVCPNPDSNGVNLCESLEKMYKTRSNIAGIISNTLVADNDPKKQQSKGRNKKITVAALARIGSDKEKLKRIANALNVQQPPLVPIASDHPNPPSTTIDVMRIDHLKPYIDIILANSPNIIKMKKTAETIKPIYESHSITDCVYFFLVEVTKTAQDQWIISTSNSEHYFPGSYLFSIDPQFAKKFEVYDNDGKVYIPLATVITLEECILGKIIDETLAKLNNDQSTKGYINDLGNFIKTSAHSLGFLQNYQAAFLSRLNHHESQSYFGVNPDTNYAAEFKSPLEASGTHQTATVAAQVLLPNSPHAYKQTTIPLKSPNSEVANLIRSASNQNLVKSLLMASMSVRENEVDDGKMEVDTITPSKTKTVSESLFTVIQRALHNTLFMALNELVIPDIQKTQLKTTLLSSMMDKYTQDQVIKSVCGVGGDQSIITLHLANVLINFIKVKVQDDLIVSLELRSLVEERLNHQNFKKRLNDELNKIQHITYESLCDAELIKEQWLKFEQTQFVSHNDTVEPEKVVLNKNMVFQRKSGQPGQLTKNDNLPLLKTFCHELATHTSLPVLQLGSKIYPCEQLKKKGVGAAATVVTGPVSVTKAKKLKFLQYYTLFNTLLPKKSKKSKKDKFAIYIKNLWQKRMKHDFHVSDDDITTALWNKTLADARVRLEDGLKRASVNKAGDEEEEAGEDEPSKVPQESISGLGSLSSSTSIPFSRKSDGISSTKTRLDKSQRCLHFCVKSIAYYLLSGILSEGKFVLVIGKPDNSEQLKIQACISYCMNARSIEGLKSSGDLLPLEMAKIMNMCHSFQRNIGVPKTDIFGGTSFDKLCTIIAHISKIPTILIDTKGRVDLIGGLRGTRSSHLLTNHISLQNNPAYVANLTATLACCDAYWLNGPLLPPPRTGRIYYLGLIISNLVGMLPPGEQSQRQQFKKISDALASQDNKTIIAMFEQVLTFLTQLSYWEKIIATFDGRYKDIINMIKRQNAEVSAQVQKKYGSYSGAITIVQRRFQSLKQLREGVIEFVRGFPSQRLEQFLTPQAASVVGTVVDPGPNEKWSTMYERLQHDSVLRPIEGTVVSPDANASEDTVMGTVVDPVAPDANTVRYQAWISDADAILLQSYRMDSGTRPVALKKILSSIALLISKGIALEKIFKRGAKKHALASLGIELSKMGIKLNNLARNMGGGKSKKRRHRRRKTRRNKKMRKKKSIKKRRKRGRKTRRK